MKILVTGGAGFIGSALVRQYIGQTDCAVVNVDKLTYAGNLESLGRFLDDPRHSFERVDICDRGEVERVFRDHGPNAVIHLAAESHVDRSIVGPADFIQTNIIGTYTLLEVARSYWSRLAGAAKDDFRFLHVSTDEVYGSLGEEGYFREDTAHRPNSPYSASKASSDHLVRAWHRTYGLPVVTSNCSNNYGPYQFPEKLIPLMILNALSGEFLPLYGDGQNVRDWLYVEDHARALRLVAENGGVGEVYNIGGLNEMSNIEVVRGVCRVLDHLKPDSQGSYERLITFVEDRPGHDRRYAIDAGKIQRELGWRPLESFESGLEKTVQWYIENAEWVDRVRSGAYRQWIEANYGNRGAAR